MSTFKSGASVPFDLHAQSFPLWRDSDTRLSALPDVDARSEVLVEIGMMPRFRNIQVARLRDYPIQGLRLTYQDSEDGLTEVSRKIFELALNYDNLKAFNVVIVPSRDATPSVYFFPRRKDGVAIYGVRRWQIAALEANGLLQAKDAQEANSLSMSDVNDIFRETSLSEDEFKEFLRQLQSF